MSRYTMSEHATHGPSFYMHRAEWYQRVYLNSRARMSIVLPGSEPAPVSTIPCAYCSAMREAKVGKCPNCGAAWKQDATSR